jgi:hypothetical protein
LTAPPVEDGEVAEAEAAARAVEEGDPAAPAVELELDTRRSSKACG